MYDVIQTGPYTKKLYYAQNSEVFSAIKRGGSLFVIVILMWDSITRDTICNNNKRALFI